MKLCTECNSKPISNSFFKLCIYCNNKRLNERKPKSTKRIKSTPRKKSVDLQKTELKEEIKKERGLLCEGCNNEFGSLTLSHTIPISLRKDLELEKENCHLECMGCHIVWEHGTSKEKTQLLNYQQKIDYIQKVDPEYYERRFKE